MSKSEIARLHHQAGVDLSQPHWCCNECGTKYGMRVYENHVATYHIGVCGVCKKMRAVTEPRDFGYLNSEWRNHEQLQRADSGGN